VQVDGEKREPIDEKESPFALCFTTKRLLSEQKILKNSRIVIVGASDTGISFVEALLAISFLQFTNITIIAPGGLPHHHLDRKEANLKAASTNYTIHELQKLMLESRTTVIDCRMTDIDRNDKNIILNDGRVVPYDSLILAMGI
jgi:NADH dehydrogenase FAD-containing subunit